MENLVSRAPIVKHLHPLVTVGATDIDLANVTWPTYIGDKHNVPPWIALNEEFHVSLLSARYPASFQQIE